MKPFSFKLLFVFLRSSILHHVFSREVRSFVRPSVPVLLEYRPRPPVRPPVRPSARASAGVPAFWLFVVRCSRCGGLGDYVRGHAMVHKHHCTQNNTIAVV